MLEVRIETEILLQVSYGCDFTEFDVTRCYSINVCVDMSCWIVASCDKYVENTDKFLFTL